MQDFKLGHSSQTDWQAALDDCLVKTGEPGTANLGFIYVTDALATRLGDILRSLKSRTGINHWVGSVGQAILCTGHEYYDQAAIVIMLAEFPDNSFSIFNHAEDTHHLQDSNPTDGLRFALAYLGGSEPVK